MTGDVSGVGALFGIEKSQKRKYKHERKTHWVCGVAGQPRICKREGGNDGRQVMGGR